MVDTQNGKTMEMEMDDHKQRARCRLDMPTSLKTLVSSFLDVRDTLAFRCTSRDNKKAGSQPYAWRPVLKTITISPDDPLSAPGWVERVGVRHVKCCERGPEIFDISLFAQLDTLDLSCCTGVTDVSALGGVTF